MCVYMCGVCSYLCVVCIRLSVCVAVCVSLCVCVMCVCVWCCHRHLEVRQGLEMQTRVSPRMAILALLNGYDFVLRGPGSPRRLKRGVKCGPAHLGGQECGGEGTV